MWSVLKAIQYKRRQHQRIIQIPVRIRRITSQRNCNGCSRNSQICRIPGRGTLRNCGGVQPKQVESEIQGSIVSPYPLNAQEVKIREDYITTIIAEEIISSWRWQWHNLLNMRKNLRSMSTTKRDNDGTGQKGIPTPTPPNRIIPVRKKNGVLE